MRVTLVLFILTPFLCFSQGIGLNQWRCHLSYGNGIAITHSGDFVYCGTHNGLFRVNDKTYEKQGLCKVDGFSDISVTALAADDSLQTVFIGYSGGNIDILKNGRITNIPDIMTNGSINGIKEIRNFSFYHANCYIATSFGIVVYNLNRNEFGDTYSTIQKDSAGGCKQISVNMTAINNNRIYAATSVGVFSAPLTGATLQDCGNWTQLASGDSCGSVVAYSGKLWAGFKTSVKYFDGNSWVTYVTGKSIRNLKVTSGKLLAMTSDSVYIVESDLSKFAYQIGGENDGVLDKSGKMWLAVNVYTCLSYNLATGETFYFRPEGPASQSVRNIRGINDEIWVASGGIDDFGGQTYNQSGFYVFKNEKWSSYNTQNVPQLKGFPDVMDIVYDSATGHKWISSAKRGIMSFDTGHVFSLLDAKNSTLAPDFYSPPTDSNAPSCGMSLDKDGNLWTVNYRAKKPFVMRKPNGQMASFDVGTELKWVTYMAIDDYNQIWAIQHAKLNGIIVYSFGEKPESVTDDQYKVLSETKGKGGLPSPNGICVAKDREGQIWIGTNDGVAVFADPGSIFTSSPGDADKKYIQSEKNYLLAGEPVTAIAVDGGNRKWLGTKRGAWLINPDGDRIIHHFTIDNSPLISNNIIAIGINNKTGEVFFGTDKGIVSYRSDATGGNLHHTDVYAYPNPVKPGYEGPISITGLVTDARVKITDVVGSLVYETKAAGGTAVWNGKNFSGVDASSGVYYVFSSNLDGSETFVTKILIVR